MTAPFDRRLEVRVSAEQKDRLEAVAAQRGVLVADLLREAIDHIGRLQAIDAELSVLGARKAALEAERADLCREEDVKAQRDEAARLAAAEEVRQKDRDARRAKLDAEAKTHGFATWKEYTEAEHVRQIETATAEAKAAGYATLAEYVKARKDRDALEASQGGEG